jgi:type VI secretion system secreted protein VgrG
MSLPSVAPFAASAPYAAELVTEDFPSDRLFIRRIVGRETISQVYRFEVLLVVRDRHDAGSSLDPDDIVGSNVRIDLVDRDHRPIRSINGIVASARQCAHESALEHAAYELEIVPRVWQLDLVRTQEIFLDMTLPEIIAAKLERIGLESDVAFRTVGDYPKREFVVQYRETALAFISRLAEHVGLSFYFEQHEGGELLVFTDQLAGFQTGSGRRVSFVARGETEGVYQISAQSSLIPGIHIVQDYNHRHPALDLTSVHSLENLGGGLVEYGTHHKSPQEGTTLAAIRAQESLSRRRVYAGKSACCGFSAGGRFTLEEHPYHEHPELLITEVHHRFEQTIGGDAGGAQGYENSFTAVPTLHPYRPPRITPRPRIDGILTGVVQVTPSAQVGVQARIDEQGSYVVQFHFDGAPNGEKASRPVRMAQPFAGPDQGMHFPLRPGTEVVIAFVDGDPDRPIIVGAMPNAHTPSPVVAADSNMHRIRSHHGLIVEFGTSTSKR